MIEPAAIHSIVFAAGKELTTYTAGENGVTSIEHTSVYNGTWFSIYVHDGREHRLLEHVNASAVVRVVYLNTADYERVLQAAPRRSRP